MLEPDPVEVGLNWVKILDFGIAKIRGSRSPGGDSDKTELGTRIGAFMGTPLYMAPEQHGHAEQADGKADVFSLGVLLYELLACRLPFQHNSLSLLSQAPLPVSKLNPTVSRRLSLLVDRMLAARASMRPTMDEVAKELTALLPKAGLGRRLSAVTGAAGLLLGALVIFLLRMERTPPHAELRNRARTVLAAYLQDRQDSVRVLTLRAIGQSRDLDQQSLLVALLQRKDRLESPAIIEEAARALGQIGALDAQPALVALLGPGRQIPSEVQVAAAGALAQLGHPRGLETLKLLLANGDELCKVRTALLLVERGDFSGAPLLWASVARRTISDSARVQVLGKLALARDPQARQRLAAELGRNNSGEVRVQIAYLLARMGDSSGWTHLKQVAMRPGAEQFLGLRLLAVLGESDGHSQLLALAAARSQPDSIRELAIAGLADSAAEDSLSVVARVLDERGASPRLRIAAAGAILAIVAGERARLGEQSLIWARAALSSDSVATRELAIAVLGDIHSEATIAPLREALRDSKPEIRRSAARALGQTKMRAALHALKGSLEDVDSEVRIAAIQAIGQLLKALERRGDHAAVNLGVSQLRRMTTGHSERDRVVASGILLILGKAQPAEEAGLRSGLASQDAQVRQLAIELAERDKNALTQALHDADAGVRLTAARHLASLGSHEGVAVLREEAAHGDSKGLSAYRALRGLGVAAAPPPGLTSLLSSGEVSARLAILDTVSVLPPADSLALMQLALIDPAALIRRRAAAAAASLYQKTRQASFLQMVHSLRNDSDVTVREQAAILSGELELWSRQPAAAHPQAAPRSAPALPPQEPDKPPPQGASLVPAAAPAEPKMTGELIAEGEASVRIRIDKNQPQSLTGKPITVPIGRHRISYLGGSQAVQIRPDQVTRVRIPVSLADQLLQDSKDAFSRKDFQHSQDILDSVRRVVHSGKASVKMQADLAYQQALLYESRQQLAAALTEYNRALNVPEGQRNSELNATLKHAVARLFGTTGRIQIFTMVNDRCQLTRELLSPPGEQTISVGKGQTRTVYVQVGSITKVTACQ